MSVLNLHVDILDANLVEDVVRVTEHKASVSSLFDLNLYRARVDVRAEGPKVGLLNGYDTIQFHYLKKTKQNIKIQYKQQTKMTTYSSVALWQRFIKLPRRALHQDGRRISQ